MARDGFFFYNNFWAPISRLGNEQLGGLFRALCEYSATGEEPAVPEDVRMAYDFIVNQFKVDAERYAEKVAQAQRASRSRAFYRPTTPDPEEERPTTDDNGRHRATTDDILNKNINKNKNKNKNKNVCVVDTTPRVTREDNTNTTPTHTDFLKVLFFRNIQKAEAETKRFEGYYDSIGWKLQGGDVLEGPERIARAEIWTPQDASPRFSRAFVDAWWKLWKVLPEDLRKKALKDGTRTKETDTELRVYCHPEVNGWMRTPEGQQAGREAFAAIFGAGRKVSIYNY